MHIKFTVQGLFIYISILCYLAAFFLSIIKKSKTANCTGFIAWIAALVAVLYRLSATGHLPMQNLFEVFLCLGAMVYPISLFSRFILKIGGFTFDMLIGFVVMFPAGFVFSAAPQMLPPALQSPLFGPHVTVYMLSYIFMAKAFTQSCMLLSPVIFSSKLKELENDSYIMVCAGFPLLTAGLLLGSLWGQLAWGNWWSWDPKEMWSLSTWLIYAGYLHWRAANRCKYPKINAALLIAGFALIFITLIWVNISNLFSGLHNYAM